MLILLVGTSGTYPIFNKRRKKCLMFKVLNATRDWNDATRLLSCNMGHIADFETTCKLAHQYGFGGINLDTYQPDQISIEDKKKLLKKYSVIPVSFGCSVNFSGSEDEFRSTLQGYEKEASIAHELGCSLTLCYVQPFSNMKFDTMYNQFVNRLKLVKPILECNKIKIAFEFIGPAETRINSEYDFIHTIDGIRCLISSAGLYNQAGFKLDAHHWQNSGATTLDLKHLDKEYILYLELNDGLPGYDSLTIPEFRRELPLTTNVTDISGFMKAVFEKGFRGPVAAEPWNQFLADLPLENAVKRVSDALDACIKIASSNSDD